MWYHEPHQYAAHKRKLLQNLFPAYCILLGFGGDLTRLVLNGLSGRRNLAGINNLEASFMFGN